jgi:hypothetical protein
MTRRALIVSAAAVSVGHAFRGAAAKTLEPTATVRPPAVGQSWKYAKHDYVTGERVDNQTDRVSDVGESIKIASHFERGPDEPITYPAWLARRLHEYLTEGLPPAASAEEIQEPWGMVLIDPHWAEVQAYERPIPLWPTQLQPGWSATVNTNYMTADRDEAMPWQLTIHAHEWESITVPAGRFKALRFHNQINFRFSSSSERVSAQRQENIWFAPDIGRWAARESWGTFFQDVGERFHETSYRWELLTWT